MTTWPISLPNQLANGMLADAVPVMADLNALLSGINDYVGHGAATESHPGDPSGSASGTGLMMGLAGTITPATTGRVLLTATGTIGNSSNSAQGVTQLRYGTGSAPANQAALTGTAVGIPIGSNLATGGEFVPFACEAIATGLALGTAYWIDLGLVAGSGVGTATVKSLTIRAVEF